MNRIHTLCVELTARCPLRCVHCSACASPEGVEMLEPAVLERNLRELESLEELYLSGGEPFEHPALERIVQSARGVARRIVVYTSGVRLGAAGNEPLLVGTLQAVRRAGVSRVDVSLYSAHAVEHDAITQTQGSFELTLETTRRLREAQIPFGVHHVPLTMSGDVLALARLVQDLGAERLHVLALAAQGRGRALEAVEFSGALREGLLRLVDEPPPFELILSSEVRRRLGLVAPTTRDALRAAMLDARGFLYPSEGQRLPMLRSRSSLGERTLRDLVAEIHAP